MQWVISNFRKWRRDGRPSNVPIQPGNTTTEINTNITTPQDKQQKIDGDILMSWKRLRKDTKDYPVLEVDKFYTKWYTNIKRQIKVDGRERVIDTNFVKSSVRPGSDHNLLELQLVFMSMVVEKVLLNSKGKKLNQSYKNHPQTL